MKGKKYSPEQVVSKLREADVLIGKGQTVADVCRQLQITDVTYYRWRKEYGGLSTDQAQRLRELESENAKLRKVIADLTIDRRSEPNDRISWLTTKSATYKALRYMQQSHGAGTRKDLLQENHEN